MGMVHSSQQQLSVTKVLHMITLMQTPAAMSLCNQEATLYYRV